MSAFSECCRQLLLESESTVYEIAKQSGLDRTSIQRMITGKRMPSIQFVEKFCSYLRITPIERTELLELYKIEKIGKELYQNRLYIRTMLESMNYQDSFDSSSSIGLPSPSTEAAPQKPVFADTQNELANLLEYIILEELKKTNSTSISTNLPVSYNIFFRFIKKIKGMLHPDFKIRHLLILNKAPALLANASYNLEVLKEVLPFIAEFSQIYYPNYIYSKSTPNDDYYYIYPYYIICSSYVLRISSDCKKALLYNNENMALHYREEFERLYSSAAPLAFCLSFSEEYALNPLHTIIDSGVPTHIAGAIPGLFFSKESSYIAGMNYFRNFFYKKDIQKLKELFKGSTKPVNIYISSEILDLYRRQLQSKDSKILRETRTILNRCLSKNKPKNFNNYIFKRDFSFPTELTILLYDSRKVIFLFTPIPDGKAIYISIDESSVCKSFLDFFDSMEESGLIHSSTETAYAFSALLETASSNSTPFKAVQTSNTT